MMQSIGHKVGRTTHLDNVSNPAATGRVPVAQGSTWRRLAPCVTRCSDKKQLAVQLKEYIFLNLCGYSAAIDLNVIKYSLTPCTPVKLTALAPLI